MIAKQIVEKFEGEISFESELGKGSCFKFTFKLKDHNQCSPGDFEPEVSFLFLELLATRFVRRFEFLVLHIHCYNFLHASLFFNLDINNFILLFYF